MTEITEQKTSDRNLAADERVRDTRHVAWYAMADGNLHDADALDTPVRIGEVYELVKVMLKNAPLDRFDPTAECIIEATNHRAWPGLLEMARRIDEECDLYEEARQC